MNEIWERVELRSECSEDGPMLGRYYVICGIFYHFDRSDPDNIRVSNRVLFISDAVVEVTDEVIIRRFYRWTDGVVVEVVTPPADKDLPEGTTLFAPHETLEFTRFKEEKERKDA